VESLNSSAGLEFCPLPGIPGLRVEYCKACNWEIYGLSMTSANAWRDDEWSIKGRCVCCNDIGTGALTWHSKKMVYSAITKGDRSHPKDPHINLKGGTSGAGQKRLGKSNSSLVSRFRGFSGVKGYWLQGYAIYSGRILWAKTFICMAKVVKCRF